MGKSDFQEMPTETFKRIVEKYFGERVGMNLILNDSRKVRFEDISCHTDSVTLFFDYNGRIIEVVCINDSDNSPFISVFKQYDIEGRKVSSISEFSKELKEILLEYTSYIDNEEHFDLEWE